MTPAEMKSDAELITHAAQCGVGGALTKEDFDRLLALARRGAETPIHPWYGPCDALADGVCAECLKELPDLHAKLKKAGEDLKVILRCTEDGWNANKARSIIEEIACTLNAAGAELKRLQAEDITTYNRAIEDAAMVAARLYIKGGIGRDIAAAIAIKEISE